MQSLLYTPVHEQKYGSPKWSHNKDHSLSFSNIQKSAYRSTEIGSHSPYRSTAVSRLEEARRNIDSVIVDLEEKRDINQGAISQTKSVNSDVLDQFRRNHSVYEKQFISSFVPESRFNYGSQDFRAAPQEDLGLRTQLNQEMRRNNELMMRVSRLQQQNRLLRRQNQMSFGPNQQTLSLQAQNDRLRRALAQSSQLPQQIFSDLQQLKRQNQQLRGDTVKLLKKIEGGFI